jgi:hypothetical protein
MFHAAAILGQGDEEATGNYVSQRGSPAFDPNRMTCHPHESSMLGFAPARR